MIDLVVSGVGGRLGRRIAPVAAASGRARVVAGLVRAGSKDEGVDLGTLGGEARPLGVAASSHAASALVAGRVLVECALKPAALEHVRLAAAAGVPALIATTGFDKREEEQIREAASRVPIMLAPNLSLGVAVLTDVVARASRALPGYHLEVLELHHAKKRDAPSGTAWALARAAAEARGQDLEADAILARAGETGPRGQSEIGLQSLRGGDIIGEHTVYLISGSERIELTHRAASRDVFAEGAVRAASFLGEPGRAPGAYTMRDVLGLAG